MRTNKQKDPNGSFCLFVTGGCPKLPVRYAGIERRDYGSNLIIPVFSELYIHAFQYFQH